MITEIKSIVVEVWNHIGIGKIPNVDTKKGGYTAVYYPASHRISFRENSWNKLQTLALKRMLVIHECFHAAGQGHSVGNGFFLSSFDLLSIEFYKKIYGEDETYIETQKIFDKYCEGYLDYVNGLKVKK